MKKKERRKSGGRDDLKGRDLAGRSFAGADLSRADLAGARLEKADFTGARLIAANFSRADLRGAKLANADLTGACLREARLEGADLRKAVLRGIQFGGVFERCDLSGAALAGNDLPFVDFEGSRLRGADLSGACLSGSSFQGCDLDEARFFGADLSGADLRSAMLRGADLSRADMQGARFHGADLTGAILAGARLWGGKGLTAAQKDWIESRGGELRSPRLLKAGAVVRRLWSARWVRAALVLLPLGAAIPAWRYWREPRNRPTIALISLGESLVAREKFEEAAAVYGLLAERRAANKRSDIDMRLMEAWCHSRLGRHEKAIALCAALLEGPAGDFDRSQILLRMGEIYEHSGDLAAAARLYRDLSEHPDLPGPRFQARLRLLSVEHRSGRSERAWGLGRRFLKESAASPPELVEFHRSLAGILADAGRAEEAAAHLRSAEALAAGRDAAP